MNSLGVVVEYVALICLVFIISGTIFFFLVEWFATSPSQTSEIRVVEISRPRQLERNDKAA